MLLTRANLDNLLELKRLDNHLLTHDEVSTVAERLRAADDHAAHDARAAEEPLGGGGEAGRGGIDGGVDGGGVDGGGGDGGGGDGGGGGGTASESEREGGSGGAAEGHEGHEAWPRARMVAPGGSLSGIGDADSLAARIAAYRVDRSARRRHGRQYAKAWCAPPPSDWLAEMEAKREAERHASISIVQAMQDEEAKAVGERERLMAEFWNLKMKG